MSLSKCKDCGELLREGELVQCKVQSTYHVLKSKIYFALAKEDMEFLPHTLKHVRCPILGPDPYED